MSRFSDSLLMYSPSNSKSLIVRVRLMLPDTKYLARLPNFKKESKVFL